MKRKLFLLFVLVFTLINNYTIAQTTCTPDDKCDTLYCPLKLPAAKATVHYDQTITLYVPDSMDINTDTITKPHLKMMYPLLKATIKDVSGFPSKFTYILNDSVNAKSMTIRSKSRGCIRLLGDPKKDDVGDYTVKFNVEVWNAPFDFVYNEVHYPTDSSKRFDESVSLPLTIHDSTYIDNSGIEELAQQNIYLKQNNPNPFSQTTTISFQSITNDDVVLSILDVTGKELFRQEIQAKQGLNAYEFDRKGLQSGIYFYRLELKENVSIKKMIIN